mmetsp:Transcript_53325/g.157019  ORF Transcript_53325/g.157019 Transcript_53325/m.157019 type:complete len:304 (-) Transcript_53325:671-1582(-)
MAGSEWISASARRGHRLLPAVRLQAGHRHLCASGPGRRERRREVRRRHGTEGRTGLERQGHGILVREAPNERGRHPVRVEHASLALVDTFGLERAASGRGRRRIVVLPGRRGEAPVVEDVQAWGILPEDVRVRGQRGREGVQSRVGVEEAQPRGAEAVLQAFRPSAQSVVAGGLVVTLPLLAAGEHALVERGVLAILVSVGEAAALLGQPARAGQPRAADGRLPQVRTRVELLVAVGEPARGALRATSRLVNKAAHLRPVHLGAEARAGHHEAILALLLRLHQVLRPAHRGAVEKRRATSVDL